MAHFDLVRQQLAEAVASAEGIRQVHAAVPETISLVPCAVVAPGEPAALYHRTSAGGAQSLAQFNFDVILFAGRFGNQNGQTELDRLIGTQQGSVVDAIENDQTLRDTAKVVHVTEAADYGSIQAGGDEYVGCRLIVEIHA